MRLKTTLNGFMALCAMLFIPLTLLHAQEQIAVIQEPFVILIDPSDGTITDPNFIDMTPQSQQTPKGIIQVGDEIWISDQIEDKIFRYDIDGVFISEIATGLDNIKGMAVINDTEVWVTNAGTNNGAPGPAIVRFDTAGTNLGFFPTTGSSFDIIDTGTEVYISYIGATTRIERRDYAGTVLGNIVEENVVTFIQQIEVNTTNNSVYAAVFSNNGANTSGLYEFAIADGSILNYYDEGSLRGVAKLDDGNVLISLGNNIRLLNTTTNTSSLLSSGGSSHYFTRVTLTPCVTPPTPTGDAAQTFDEGATLADIVVDPTNVTWFATEMDALNNTNALDNSTLLEDGETYYAVNIVSGCLSDPFAVTVTVNCIPPATPTGDAFQTFTEGATLADVVVEPTTVTWFATEMDALNNTNPIPLSTLLENGENYFAVNIVNDCLSAPLEVTVAVECIPATTPTGEALQTLPEGSTLADVVVNPAMVAWFATQDDALALTNELPLSTILEDGENYFAVNGALDCPSTPFEVTVMLEVLGASDFNTATLAIYPNPVTAYVTLAMDIEIDSVTITNILGQTVFAKEVHANQAVLDLSGLSNGIYLVTANVGDRQAKAKILKE
jgi:Secretion system C-terminal sorting domain